MAGTGDEHNTEWCWILNEIDFVIRHGAGTTRETATQFLLSEIAAGRIPYRYDEFWIAGPAVTLDYFWLPDPSVRHEVAIDNAVVRNGPGVTLAMNAKGELTLVLATAPPVRTGITRLTLVRLDHAAVVRRLQAALPRQRSLTVVIAEVPTHAAKSEQASASATELQSVAEKSAPAESELDWGNTEQVMRTLEVKGPAQKAITEAIAKLPEHNKRYRGRPIPQILQGMGGEDLRNAIGFPPEKDDSCRRFMDAWKAKYPD